MMPYYLPLVALVCSVSLSQAWAAEPSTKPDAARLIGPDVIDELQKSFRAEIVMISVEAQNERLGKIDEPKILSLDDQWKREREADDKPLIAATLSNPLSVYLTRMQGKSLGLYAEIFVMDQNGLNVGQSSITSDFWQGDEAKYQKTFLVSKNAVFIDEAEWDEDAKIWRGQVSFTLTDKVDDRPIGAVTVEMNLTELARRQSSGS